MGLKQAVMERAVEPAAVRFFQWRGDPVARLMHRSTKIDPYPLWADVRRRGLSKSPLGIWITASHATATEVLLDRRFSSSPTHQTQFAPPTYPSDDPRADLPYGDLLVLDPPDHTRIRRLVSSAFSPRAIAGLEPFIRETTTQLLSACDPTGFELVDDLAFKLPIAVICKMLGVPPEDEASFRVWGNDVAATLDAMSSREREKLAGPSERALVAYLKELVATRRADPDDSLLSALIAAEEEGDRLTSGELVATALLLLVAGFETTVNLIGNGVVALLSSPAQWERVRDDPSSIPGAVEEVLRYDSPVQLTGRTATEDLVLGETPFTRGQQVVVAVGGANRDPAVFDDADALRIDRPNANKHLSFSLGIHHCLGAALARLEGRVALEEITRTFPRLEITAAPTRRSQLVLRGFEHIPVRVPSAPH